MRPIDRTAVLRFLAVAAVSLGAATVAIAILQDGFGVPNPSALYLVAVVATAIVSGTWGAVLTSVAAFLLYNLLFVDPRYTLTVAQPREVVNLLVLLFVGIVVGQLAALQRIRAEDAIAREREARSLFQVSRALATRATTLDVLPSMAQTLVTETEMTRAWVGLGGDGGAERVVADTQPDEPRPAVTLHQVLQRMPGDTPPRWDRIHQPGAGRDGQATGVDVFRIRMVAGDQRVGSIWAVRPRSAASPSRTDTRLLAAAADQIGQALRQDQLAAEARAADVARQSDALKSALLQSVSHDLRTPLATIRAAAGTLRPGSGLTEAEQLESSVAIDREVEYLNRLVTNLLDLSRIEAGALRAERDVFELDELVERTIERMAPQLAGRPVEVAVEPRPVDVDPVFLDEAVTNVIENALKYAGPDAPIRVHSEPGPEPGMVRLTIEDGGEGVPDELLPRLFEKFYRVPGGRGGSRSGTGIGLAVVRGLLEAMGAQVNARRGELGGLAIDMDLLGAEVPTTQAGSGSQ